MTERAGRRRCLVTGAAGSIGEGIARELGARGHELVLIDRSEAVRELAATLSGSAHVVDISKLGSLNALAAQLGEDGIDVLVNNAARVGTIDYIHRLAPEDWAADLAVNLSAPFHLTALFVQGMASRGWGRVISVGSIAAGGLYRQASYAASKAGLEGFTKTVALEYGAHGVTANVVEPGLIASAAVKQMPTDIVDEALRQVPAGRVGALREVAALVGFLASEEAGYVNGSVIPVDGGATSTQMRMVRRHPDGPLR